MGRRTNLASLANEKVEDVPGHSTPTLVRLRPAQIAPTPLNPRRSFGTEKELTELGESMQVRQLQPVVVVSRAAYLRLWPDHTETIGAAEFVLANGERRYKAASHIDLTVVDAVIREEVAESRAAFLDALLTENLDRKSFDPIEEAQAVEAMVRECGTAKAAATQFRRHETWVSQRRALLKLNPQLQERVRSGELPVRIARSIASVPHDEQEQAWQNARAEEERRRTTKAAAPAADGERDVPSSAAERPSSAHAPGPNRDSSEPAHDDGVFTAVKTPSRAPDGRGAAAPAQIDGVPWSSPERLAALIRHHVPRSHVMRLIELLRADHTVADEVEQDVQQ